MKRLLSIIFAFALWAPAFAQSGGGVVNGSANALAYEGVATTNNRTPNTNTAASTWSTSRTTQWTRVNSPSLTVYVPTCWVTSANVETCLAGTTNIKASVELASGTILPCNGGNPVAITSAVTDHLARLFCPNVNQAAGALIYIRTSLNNTNGIPYISPGTSGVVGSFAPGDGFIFGTGTPTDLTGGGTVTPPVNETIGFGPIAVTTPASASPSICGLGDSKMTGEFDSVNDQTGDTGYSRIWGQTYPYVNLGTNSTKGSDFVANAHLMRDTIISKCSILVDEYGVNDGSTAAALVTMRTAVAALYPNVRVYGTTIGPDTASTDMWATTTNQSQVAVSIATFNTSERTGIAKEVGTVDIVKAIDPMMINVYPVAYNLFATSGTAFFCTPSGSGQGLHENPTCYGIERDNLQGTLSRFRLGN